MSNKKILMRLSLAMLAVMLTTGLPAISSAAGTDAKAAAAQKDPNVIKGKVLGISKKGKAFTIKGSKGPMMVKFNDATKGMKFAKKGAAAIVKFKVSGDDKVATIIKPKLAKLPKGVAEIQPEELIKLLNMGPEKGNYMLVDARPTGPFNKGHIRTAQSIPVKKMKEKGKELMPMNAKDIQLIFYCGGVT